MYNLGNCKMSVSKEKLWIKAARTIVKAGQMPMPISDTLIELLQTLMTDEQAEFILNFKKPSLNIDEIKTKTGLDESSLNKILNDLMDNGIVVGLPSRRTGIMVYRLLGPFPGLFEYTNLKGEFGEEHEKRAKLFAKLFKEMGEGTQKNFDNLMNQFKNFPPINRIVPVEQEIEDVPVDKILPFEEISRIIDKFDDIALAHCYCRHQNDLLHNSCKVTDERKNCFLLGKSAQFAIRHNFGESVSKEEAKKIMDKASDEGLVHKSFHIHLKTELDEEAICNCCACCCGPFQFYFRGVMPLHAYSSYLANVNEQLCIACETCIEKCPMEAIELIDEKAKVDGELCIGCGVCAHHCLEKAIELERTGMREIFIPPKKTEIKQN
jgi:Pyruvate/2-oxoacid:ferredoxin oxidoreductase delta subunit